MRSGILILFTIILLPIVSAVPSNIQLQSGTLVDGSSVTITGNNFGASTNPTILLWEDFEFGNDQDSIALNGWIPWTQGIPEIDTGKKVSGSRSAFAELRGADGLGFKAGWKPITPSNKVFWSYWAYWDSNDPDEANVAIKWGRIRTRANGDAYGSPPGITWDIDGNASWYRAGFKLYPGGLGYPQPDLFQASTPAIEAGRWHRMDSWLELSQPCGTANGNFDAWVDGVSNGNFPVNNVITCQPEFTGPMDSVMTSHNAAHTGANPKLVWNDDFYISDTMARVELCNGPSLTSTCHIQIPSSWSDGSISFDVNLGSFTQTEIDNGLYLFVVDENNVASSPLLISSSNPNPGTPYVSSVDNLVHGSFATISGFDFGTIPNITPLIYEDMESGSFAGPLRGGSYSSLMVPEFIVAEENRHPFSQYTAKHTYWGSGSRHSGFGGEEVNSNTRKFFASYWIKLDPNWVWGTGFSGSAGQYLSNFKMFRFEANEPASNGEVVPDPVNDDFAVSSWGYEPSGLGQWLYYTDTSLDTQYFMIGYTNPSNPNYITPGVWHNFQVEYQVNSAIGSEDGKIKLWSDGELVSELSSGIDTDKNILAEYWHVFEVGFYNSWGSENYDWDNVWIDEVFATDTFARVEICEGSSWNNKGHCEVQIPTSWNDGQVVIDVKQNSLPSGQTLYLYLVDDNGVVSNPKTVTFEQQTNPNPGTPYITNVPTLSDDAVVTINGMDFGVNSNPEPFMYDDQTSYSGLSNGDNIPVQSSGCVSCLWRDYWYWNIPQYYTGANVRVAGEPVYRAPQGAAGFRGPDAGFSESDKVYLSWWVRSDWHLYERLNEPGNPTFNKLVRYTANSGSGWVDQIEIEPQYVYGTRDGCGEPNQAFYGNSFYGALPINEWTNIELILDGGGNLAAGSGTFEVYFNKNLVATGNSLYSCNGMIDNMYEWGSDPLSPSNYPASIEMLFGDLYWDNSWARVELCNAGTYASVTHCELQLINNWQTTSIQFTTNLGSFTQVDIDAGLYLFVIDADGDVSPGHLVSISGSVSQCSTNLDCSSYGDGICTVGVCNAGSCEQQFTTNSCDDGDVCTVGDVCSNGVCSPGSPNSGLSCDDGISCTLSSSCVAGVCVGDYVGGLCPDNPNCGSAMCTVDGCVYSDCSYDPSLVAYYPLDGSYEDVISGNDMTCSNCPSFVIGKQGQAVRFSGSELLTASDSVDNSGLSEVTVSFWIKDPEFFSGYNQFIVAKSGYSGGREYRIRSEGTNKLVWHISNDGEDPDLAEAVYDASLISPGSWNLITGTWDGSNLIIYRNGNEVSRGTSEVGPSFDGTMPLSIGGAGNNEAGAVDNFVGLIDDVRIYNRALSPSEVRALNDGIGVVVTPTFDFDSDGVIGLDDLFILSQYFGGVFVDGDYDNDGKITIIDLVKHINNWN